MGIRRRWASDFMVVSATEETIVIKYNKEMPETVGLTLSYVICRDVIVIR